MHFSLSKEPLLDAKDIHRAIHTNQVDFICPRPAFPVHSTVGGTSVLEESVVAISRPETLSVILYSKHGKPTRMCYLVTLLDWVVSCSIGVIQAWICSLECWNGAVGIILLAAQTLVALSYEGRREGIIEECAGWAFPNK